MLLSRDTILTDLREYVMEVTFNKQNGEQRVMRCTLRPDLLPPTYSKDITEEKKFHAENTNVISAWDMQKRGWRSFRIDSVKFVQDVSHNY